MMRSKSVGRYEAQPQLSPSYYNTELRREVVRSTTPQPYRVRCSFPPIRRLCLLN